MLLTLAALALATACTTARPQGLDAPWAEGAVGRLIDEGVEPQKSDDFSVVQVALLTPTYTKGEPCYMDKAVPPIDDDLRAHAYNNPAGSAPKYTLVTYADPRNKPGERFDVKWSMLPVPGAWEVLMLLRNEQGTRRHSFANYRFDIGVCWQMAAVDPATGRRYNGCCTREGGWKCAFSQVSCGDGDETLYMQRLARAEATKP